MIDAISSFSSVGVATAAGRDKHKQQIITSINTVPTCNRPSRSRSTFSNLAIQAQSASSTG